MFPLKFLSSNYFHSSNNSIYIFPPQLTEFTWIKVIIATPKMAINVKINTLNFDNKLKDCSSRRATEDHVTIRKTRGYKAKLGLGFWQLLMDLKGIQKTFRNTHAQHRPYAKTLTLAMKTIKQGGQRVDEPALIIVWMRGVRSSTQEHLNFFSLKKR